jgi:hypothetical protein
VTRVYTIGKRIWIVAAAPELLSPVPFQQCHLSSGHDAGRQWLCILAFGIPQYARISESIDFINGNRTSRIVHPSLRESFGGEGGLLPSFSRQGFVFCI